MDGGILPAEGVRPVRMSGGSDGKFFGGVCRSLLSYSKCYDMLHLDAGGRGEFFREREFV